MSDAISRRASSPRATLGTAPDARGGLRPTRPNGRMKTSDLHIAESGGNGAGGTLRAFFSLDWLGAKSKKKKKSKFKAGTHPSAGGQPDGKTKVSQQPADVLKLLRDDG